MFSGGTRTDLALKMAEEKVFCDSCGVRPDVPKVLIVITDGKSSYTSTSMTQASKGLKVCRVLEVFCSRADQELLRESNFTKLLFFRNSLLRFYRSETFHTHMHTSRMYSRGSLNQFI